MPNHPKKSPFFLIPINGQTNRNFSLSNKSKNKKNPVMFVFQVRTSEGGADRWRRRPCAPARRARRAAAGLPVASSHRTYSTTLATVVVGVTTITIGFTTIKTTAASSPRAACCFSCCSRPRARAGVSPSRL